jgi:hypothetical protein
VILFPVNGKVPAVPKGTHWKDYDGPPPPADQPAGWAIPEGVLVVDIDGEEGMASVEEAGLPGSPLHWASLSGKGMHFVYLADGEAKNRRVLPGVDVKTHGGYVVVPAAGREKLASWDGLFPVEMAPPAAPAWAYERAVPKPAKQEGSPLHGPPSDAATAPSGESTVSRDGWREWHPRTPLEERCRRVAEAPEGERNETLNREAYLYGLEWGEWDHPDAEQELAEAGIQAGLEHSEAHRTALSGLVRGTEEHVDPLAGVRRAEPDPPTLGDVPTCGLSAGKVCRKHNTLISPDRPCVPCQSEQPGVPDPTPEVEGPTHRRRRKNADILALTSPRWLLPGRVMDGLNLVVGFPKSGKSIMSVAWAWEAARLGKRVLYVPAEHEQQFKPLLQAWIKVNGDEGAENLEWWYEEQVLRDPDQHAELMVSLAEDPVDLVVIDTLSAAAGGMEENEAGTHVDLAANAAEFTKDGRSRATLLIHHTGLDKTRATGSSAQLRRPVVYSVLDKDDKVKEVDPEGRGWSKLVNKASRFAGAKDQWYAFTEVPILDDPDPDEGWSQLSHSHVCEAADPPALAYDDEPASSGTPAKDKALAVLRALAPGQVAPSISALALSAGVGKNAARDALKEYERDAA